MAKGIDINLKDNIRNDYTPLMSSSYHGHLEITKYLIEQGADVNAKCKNKIKGLTALMETCKLSCNTKTAELLIEKGADVNAKDKNGKTALDIAIELSFKNKRLNEFESIKNLIISKGGKRGIEIKPRVKAKAKIKQKSNDFGMSM